MLRIARDKQGAASLYGTYGLQDILKIQSGKQEGPFLRSAKEFVIFVEIRE